MARSLTNETLPTFDHCGSDLSPGERPNIVLTCKFESGERDQCQVYPTVIVQASYTQATITTTATTLLQLFQSKLFFCSYRNLKIAFAVGTYQPNQERCLATTIHISVWCAGGLALMSPICLIMVAHISPYTFLCILFLIAQASSRRSFLC